MIDIHFFLWINRCNDHNDENNILIRCRQPWFNQKQSIECGMYEIDERTH